MWGHWMNFSAQFLYKGDKNSGGQEAPSENSQQGRFLARKWTSPFLSCHLHHEAWKCVYLCSAGLLSARCHWVTAVVAEPERDICSNQVHAGGIPSEITPPGIYFGIFSLGLQGWVLERTVWVLKCAWGRELTRETQAKKYPDHFCRNSQSYENPYWLLMVLNKSGHTKSIHEPWALGFETRANADGFSR